MIQGLGLNDFGLRVRCKVKRARAQGFVISDQP